MANLKGFNRTSLGAVYSHWSRHDGDPDQSRHTYKNIKIDPSRTHLNYNLRPVANPMDRLRSEIERSGARPTKRTNVAGCWVVTAPQGFPADRLCEFFEQAVEHVEGIVGRDSILGAWVHMDETTPHVHIAFSTKTTAVAMTNDKSAPLLGRDGKQKTDARGVPRWRRIPLLDENGNAVTRPTYSLTKIFDRTAMKAFHGNLSKRMEKHFGYDVGILLSDEQAERKALSRVHHEELEAASKAVGTRIAERTEEARADLSAAVREAANLRGEIEEARAEIAEARKWVLGIREAMREVAEFLRAFKLTGLFRRWLSERRSHTPERSPDMALKALDRADEIARSISSRGR